MSIMRLQSTKNGMTGKDKNGHTWVMMGVVNRDLSAPEKPFFATLKAFGKQADALLAVIKPIVAEDGKFITAKSYPVNINTDNVVEAIDLNGEARVSYIWSEAKEEEVVTEAPAPSSEAAAPFNV